MSTCNPRTDENGTSIFAADGNWSSLKAQPWADTCPDYKFSETELPFVDYTLAELRDRNSKALDILIYYVVNKFGIQPQQIIRYCHYRSTHFIKINKHIIACRKEKLFNVKFLTRRHHK